MMCGGDDLCGLRGFPADHVAGREIVAAFSTILLMKRSDGADVF